MQIATINPSYFLAIRPFASALVEPKTIKELEITGIANLAQGSRRPAACVGTALRNPPRLIGYRTPSNSMELGR